MYMCIIIIVDKIHGGIHSFPNEKELRSFCNGVIFGSKGEARAYTLAELQEMPSNEATKEGIERIERWVPKHYEWKYEAPKRCGCGRDFVPIKSKEGWQECTCGCITTPPGVHTDEVEKYRKGK